MAAPNEDDDSWLYGDKVKQETQSEENLRPPGEDPPPDGSEKGPETSEEVKEEKEAGEVNGAEEEATSQKENKDDDDSDDSDDDVQVTIGDIKLLTDQPRNLFKGTGGYQKQVASAGKQKSGLDVDTVGTTQDGESIYDVDLDSINNEDKPWRKPGADITDYFNYGFNEDSWKIYCDRQRRLRSDNNVPFPGKIFTPTPSKILDNKDTISPITGGIPIIHRNFKMNTNQQPAYRKTSGTIDVIGSTAKDSRRPNQMGEIQTIGTTATAQKIYSMPPPTVPTHITVPPPDFALPPPGVPQPIPPPGMPPPGITIIPAGFPPAEPYDTYYPQVVQSGAGGRPTYDNRTSYGYDNPPVGYPTYNAAGSHGKWDNRSTSDYNRWGPGDYNRGGDSDFSSSDSDREYPTTRYRSDRDIDNRGKKDYYNRNTNRDRDRERDRKDYRDRSRSEDGDKDRRHRDKDDKHRTRRKHKEDEEADAHKSKHKKSKKSKREKDGDEASVAGDDAVKAD